MISNPPTARSTLNLHRHICIRSILINLPFISSTPTESNRQSQPTAFSFILTVFTYENVGLQ